MKLTYLGTAAAEGIPAIFCDCAVCKTARALGKKEIRTRSQALINDDLLLDFPADAYMHMLQNGLEYSKIRHILFTHAHEDHLYAGELEMAAPAFAHPQSTLPIRVYGSRQVLQQINTVMYATMGSAYESRVQPVTASPYQTLQVGKYTATVLPAIHDVHSGPQNYIIGDSEKNLLYAHDTDVYPDAVWQFLKESGLHIDLASLDCTQADGPINYTGHMNLERCVQFRRLLTECGAADAGTRYVLNHFSHNGGHVLYRDLTPIAERQGFAVSYDGMQVQI